MSLHIAIRRVLGGKGTLTVTTATCPGCAAPVPVDPDGWDALCAACAADEQRALLRLRRQREQLRRYCPDCGGRHIPWVFHAGM